MTPQRIIRFPFKVFLKMSLVYGGAIGFVAGVVAFLAAGPGGTATIHLTGTGGALLLFGPVAVALLALLIAPIVYLPFTWTLQLVRGLVLDDPREAFPPPPAQPG